MQLLTIGEDLFIEDGENFLCYVGGMEKLKEDLKKAPIEYISSFVDSNLPIMEYNQDRARKLFQEYKQQYILYTENREKEEDDILDSIEKAIEDNSINKYDVQINLIRRLTRYDEGAADFLVGIGVVLKQKYLEILKRVAGGKEYVGELS